MTTSRPKLEKDDFYSQFHNEKHHDQSDFHSRPEWYELYDDVPEKFARGGSAIEMLRGNKHHKTTASHPALNIPGVHIRTAEAGEPIFHGEK